MTTRKICLIAPEFADYIGGVETHAVEFANHFVKPGKYSIRTIIVNKPLNGKKPPFYQVPAPREKTEANNIDMPVDPALEGTPEKDAKAVLDRTAPREDIYFLNKPAFLPAVALIKRKYPSMRVVVRSGGSDFFTGPEEGSGGAAARIGAFIAGFTGRASGNRLVGLINDYAEKLIVNSGYSRDNAVESGVKKEKLVKVSGGVDCERFKPALNGRGRGGTLRLVSSARLVKFKGLEYSLKAVKEAVERYGLDIEYTIIGDGPERRALEKLAGKLGISGKVRFAGAVRFSGVAAMLAENDVFLHLPVRMTWEEPRGSKNVLTETMGRSICEAAACALPAVASDVGGVPEIVSDGETGFLVGEKDYEAAAERINRLAADPELRKRMSANARAGALEHFDFKTVFAAYEDVFGLM